MEKEKKTFKIGAYLESKGYSFSGLDQQGNPLVSKGGEEPKAFNTDAFLKSKGMAPGAVDIEWNSPDSPMDKQIVDPSGDKSLPYTGQVMDVVDRLKMSAGNDPGRIDFLKNKKADDTDIVNRLAGRGLIEDTSKPLYQQVQYHPEQGLITKKKGVWERVDAEGNDAWELTKDIADGVPLVGSIGLSAIGGVLGTMAGGPGGGIAGAGIGGGAAEYIKTSLGRAYGTYKGTPEEQMADIGQEILLNAGGQTLGLGMKPTLKMLSKGAKFIGEKASPVVKNVLAETWGALTGKGPEAVKTLIENPEIVPMKVQKYSSKFVDKDKAIDELSQGAIKKVGDMMEKAPQVLSQRFEALQGDLLKQVPNSFKGEISAPILSSMADMQKAGIGKMMVGKESAEQYMSRTGGKALNPKDVWFKMSGAEDIKKMIANGEFPDRLSDKSLKAIGEYVEAMNQWVASPVKNGKAGAAGVLKAKRALSQVAFSVKEEHGAVASKLTEFSAKLDDALAGNFADHGLEVPFKKINDMYSGFVETASEAKRLINGQTTLETFSKKLRSQAGMNPTSKGFRDDLVELMGTQASDVLKDVETDYAASQFVKWIPDLKNPLRAMSAGGVFTGAATNAIPVAGAGLAASQASPKLVMKQVQYANKLFNHLGGMSKTQLASWLQNPAIVGATIRETIKAGADEEGAISELLKQTGADNGQQ